MIKKNNTKPFQNDKLFNVRAPVMGVFYRAPEPGAAPYIELDQNVTKEQVCCLLEVMKVYTSVKCGVDGKVVEILVEDGEMIEKDQTLFKIATD